MKATSTQKKVLMAQLVSRRAAAAEDYVRVPPLTGKSKKIVYGSFFLSLFKSLVLSISLSDVMLYLKPCPCTQTDPASA